MCLKKIVWGVGVVSSVLCASAQIVVDAEKERQEFFGFGAQIWTRHQQLEPAFADLGMRWVRMDVSGMREIGFKDGSVEDFRNYFEGRLNKEAFRSTFEMLKRNNVTIMLNCFGIPDIWMDDQTQLRPERVGDFARMWAGAVQYFIENGMEPHWLELFNEPDGTWSGRCWPAEYNEVVKQTRRELDGLGYQHIQICGPGLAHIDWSGRPEEKHRWITDLDPEGVAAHGAWSTHGYEWHRRESAAVLREEVRKGFLAAAQTQDPEGEKPLLVTEYGTFNSVFHGKEHPNARDSYFEWTVAQLPAWNVRVIENGLSFLNEGFHALIYWQLADVHFGSDNFGIFTRLQDGGVPQMVHDALRGLFPEIAEGYRVLDIRQDREGSPLYAAALRNGSRLVVCVVNHSDRAHETRLILENYPEAKLIRRHVFELGRLSTTEPGVDMGGEMVLRVPGDSYVTLVFEEPLSEATSVATVYPTKKLHRVEGFGGCAWIGDPGSLTVLPELGMRWVRFNMEGINTFDQPELPAEEYRHYFEQVTEWDRIRYLWSIKEEMDLTFMMVSFGAPPCWMDEHRELKPEHAEDFARLWAAAVRAYADKGFTPEWIELFNEPDGRWDAYCPPETYNQVVKAARRELDRLGLQQVRIAGPGRANIDFGPSDAWVDGLDEEAVKALSAWSVHSWTFNGPESHCPEYVRNSLPGFMTSVRQKDPEGRKLRMMTEFSTKDYRFHGVEYRDHAVHYRDTAADTVPFAVHVTENLLSHLDGGMQVILFWQMSDQWWEEAAWGLMGRMSDAYPRRPIFDALKILLPEISQGFRVVKTEQEGEVWTTAFARGTRLVVGLVNSSLEEQVQSVTVDGVGPATLFKMNRFDRTGTRTTLPRQRIDGNWSVRMPPESVTVAVFEIQGDK